MRANPIVGTASAVSGITIGTYGEKEDAMKENMFQMHELEAFLGDHVEDFDIEAIIGEATEIDCSDGNRYWKEGIDLNAICQKHDVSGRKTAAEICSELGIDFGGIEYDGVGYEFVTDPSDGYGNVCTGNNECAVGFTAYAVKSKGRPDEDGLIDAYCIEWAVPENAESTDDVDWDDPFRVQEYGAFDPESGRII